MAPTCLDKPMAQGLGGTWRVRTHVAARTAGFAAPVTPGAQPARPVLLALASLVDFPPPNEPSAPWTSTSHATAFFTAPLALAPLTCCRASTAIAVASVSGVRAALAAPSQDWSAAVLSAV